jgi:hypothetical protein
MGKPKFTRVENPTEPKLTEAQKAKSARRALIRSTPKKGAPAGRIARDPHTSDRTEPAGLPD